MRIAVIGSGYAGTTLAAGLAECGHDVVAVDIDEAIVDRLNAGESPIHEPGLDAIIEGVAGETLTATTDYTAIADAALVFVAVQTPSQADGSIDVTAVRAATKAAVEALRDHGRRADGHVIVIKSTVTPPQLAALRDDLEEWRGEADIELAANPEFLREGSAVEDFRTPDKLVFGVDSTTAEQRLREAFEPIITKVEPAVFSTDPETAAMIKYANNTFLAAKISLINELGNICKTFGIDAYAVAEAIGSDHRIGASFLRSGVGYGGSCFPKDISAIIAAARTEGYDPSLLDAVIDVNERQPQRLLDLLDTHVDVAGKRVAVLGLAFKPGTDDIRHSRAIPVIHGLLDRGADVVAYDPVATENMRHEIPEITYGTSAAEALADASAAVVVTEWDEFAALDGEFDAMREKVVIDGRRVIEPTDGMTYEGLAW